MDETMPIPHHVLKAVGRSAAFRLLGLLNYALACSGLTVDELASRLGWSRRRVVRFLKGRARITLRDAALVAFAIDGSQLQFTAAPAHQEQSK